MTDIEFEAQEWLRLAPRERVNKCRLFAADAAIRAIDGPPFLREVYSDLTRQWATLADDILAGNTAP